jgi:antitoxin component of RelBE/YafQ-DinJ toxin-antitoxin module
MTSSVLYVRVPTPFKEALDQVAEQRGVTLSTAVKNLLEEGLEAAANEESIRSLKSEISELRAREEANSNAYSVLARSLKRPVGSCPSCRKVVSGNDLLLVGSCGSCGKGLTALLKPKNPPEGGLDGNEYLLLVGAIGLVLGAAMLSK